MNKLLLAAGSALALSSAAAGASTWVRYDIRGHGDYEKWDGAEWLFKSAAMRWTVFIDVDAPDYGVPAGDSWAGHDEWYAAAVKNSSVSFSHELKIDDGSFGAHSYWNVTLKFAAGSFSTFPSHFPKVVENSDFYWMTTSHWHLEDASGSRVWAKAKIVPEGGPWLLKVAVVPEPASWTLMLGGFAMIGGSIRRQKAATRVGFA